MAFVLNQLTILLFASAAVAFLFSLLAWRKRHEAGGSPLAGFLVTVGLGAIAYGIDIAYTTMGPKVFWFKSSAILQTVVIALWILTALEYAGKSDRITTRSLTALFLPPALLSIGIALPATSQHFATLEPTATVGPVRQMNFGIGPLFVLWLFYSIIGTAIASGLFFLLFVRARNIYRVQATTIAVAAVLPWLDVVLNAFGYFEDYTLTIPLLTLSGIALTVGLYEFDTLNPVPAAHETIVEKIGNGIVVIDDHDVIGDINPFALDVLAPDQLAEALVGTPIAEHFDDWEAIDAPRTEPSDWQTVSVDTGSGTRFFEVQVIPFFDYYDDPVGRIVVMQDVTERERRERALARFEYVFESVRDWVYVLDDDGRFELVNEPFADALGYDRSDLEGTPFTTILTSDDSLPPASEMDEAPVEMELERRDGERIPCETNRAPIEVDIEGLEGGSVGFVRDISRRKRVERSLEETTQRYETIVDASPVAIVAVSPTGIVERWNPAAEAMFGYPPADVLGDPLAITAADETNPFRSVQDRVLDGEQFTDLEAVLRRRDGERFDASISIAPVTDDDADVFGAVLVIADMSDRKERERRLQRQNERLEEFASIVSHDLRNPLNVAEGRLDLARETGDDEHLEIVEESLDRADEIIEETLALARQGQEVTDTEPLDIAAVARDTWTHVESSDATLSVQTTRTVHADETRLTRALENLYRNALTHGPDTVTVTVGDCAGGFYVADDGPGIPRDARSDVFEKGYSTDPDGTGFGLSIVEAAIEAHDWSITVTDSESGGARFEVTGIDRSPSAVTETESHM